MQFRRPARKIHAWDKFSLNSSYNMPFNFHRFPCFLHGIACFDAYLQLWLHQLAVFQQQFVVYTFPNSCYNSVCKLGKIVGSSIPLPSAQVGERLQEQDPVHLMDYLSSHVHLDWPLIKA